MSEPHIVAATIVLLTILAGIGFIGKAIERRLGQDTAAAEGQSVKIQDR